VEAFSLTSDQVDGLLPLADMDDYIPVPYGAAVYRIRYTTQEKGQTTEATSLVSFPDVDTGASVPTLLQFHGTTGFTDACAPSNMTILEASPAIVTAALGAFVVHPDYPGMMGMGDGADAPHALLLPEPSVIASLDAIRAAEQLVAELGNPVTPDPDRVVFWGLSEGALFALWAERYGRVYLPDWRPQGVVAVAPPMNISALLQQAAIEFGRRTGVLVAASIGAAHWHAEVDRLPALFTPGAIEEIETQIETVCDVPEFADISSVEEVFQPDVLLALQAGEGVEPVRCYLDATALTDTTLPADPAVPVLVLAAEADDLVAPELARAEVTTLCDQGLTVVYEECAGFSHEDALLRTIARQTAWAFDRLEGAPLTDPTCVVQEPIDCEG